MKKPFLLLFFSLFMRQAFCQVQFPLGVANRDGTAVIEVIGRQATYPTYNDKVFYADPNGNANSYLFPDFGQASTSIGGCTFGSKYMYWVVEYKVDNLNNVRTLTINPSPGDYTKTVVVVAHNVRRTQCVGGGENNSFINVKSFTIKVETPEWQDLEDLKNVCNNVDNEYNLVDHFSVKEGTNFYLDNIGSTPITKLNPKDLSPGYHRLIAQKRYDNGTPDPQFGSKPGIVTTVFEFNVLEGVPITLTPYPSILCNNGTPITIVATPTGGAWEGRGIDGAGNITPSSASIGRNIFTYKFTNTNSCLSTKSIEIYVNSAPTIDVEDLEVCRTGEPFNLLVALPVGGNYVGRGVVNNIFYPSQALVGSNSIRYFYTDPNTGCSATGDFSIEVKDADNFRVGDDWLTCSLSAEIDLNNRSGVSPNDGTILWSGPGVINNKYFDPKVSGVGLHTITGTLYYPETGCTFQKTVVVKVSVGPTVEAGEAMAVCNNASSFLIPGGSPTGGTWTGSYISSNIFTPTATLPGDYIASYTYDNGECVLTAKKIISVKPAPVVSVGPALSICRNAGLQPLPAAVPTGGRWAADGDYLDA
ncbi:hypothetical protein LX64_05172, partial [Chitinophaga skermanii]